MSQEMSTTTNDNSDTHTHTHTHTHAHPHNRHLSLPCPFPRHNIPRHRTWACKHNPRQEPGRASTTRDKTLGVQAQPETRTWACKHNPKQTRPVSRSLFLAGRGGEAAVWVVPGRAGLGDLGRPWGGLAGGAWRGEAGRALPRGAAWERGGACGVAVCCFPFWRLSMLRRCGLKGWLPPGVNEEVAHNRLGLHKVPNVDRDEMDCHDGDLVPRVHVLLPAITAFNDRTFVRICPTFQKNSPKPAVCENRNRHGVAECQVIFSVRMA